jgi:hypothetical protein
MVEVATLSVKAVRIRLKSVRWQAFWAVWVAELKVPNQLVEINATQPLDFGIFCETHFVFKSSVPLHRSC